MAQAAQSLVRMLDELGRVTDEPGKLTRTFLSPAMKRANTLVAGWMQAAGLTVHTDTVGNLIGQLPAAKPQTPDPKPKTLLLGSHLDTVRDAGRFDGPLGVLLPIVALAELRRRGVTLPFNVEVLGFSEEEGVRFASAYLGSEGYTGRLKPATLALRDANGISVGEAIARWNGLTSSRSSQRLGVKALHLKPAHTRRDLLGYVEVHIEQGPVLEQKNLSVGVVSAIAGQSRFKLTWTGHAGHAGTTPMALRRDALAAAAEFTVGIESIARRTPGLVATVGALTVAPGAANVIPGRVEHTLDVRHADDRIRRRALLAIGRLATQIATRRRVSRTWQRTQENRAVACSRPLTAALARSVAAIQGKSVSLVSGAGHDGVVMSRLTPIAMLFVRCRAGLSHHPDEYAAPKDLAVALHVMIHFLETLAAEQSS
jgi:allantoate deiminase